MGMRIWVDADACPSPVKDIVANAAHRRNIDSVFVANKPLSILPSPYNSFVQVDMSPDAADRYIDEHAQKGDLVITNDIPLAHALVPKNIAVINPRGERYTPDNIGELFSLRNFMQERRDSGEVTGGPKQFGDRERRAFAATFDRELTRLLKDSL